ncbi:hypothetical protein ABT167_05380 [Streptomyces sp. NPDC001792]|uniref:hypothetical protein n=1 Tax=Streptomyces sp. NPDC001792 TaxID=3154524 RepID=UPI0033330605
MAALICTKAGHRPRLIYRIHLDRGPSKGRHKGFTETDYARLLDAAHQQLGGPIVLVWDNLNTHVSRTTGADRRPIMADRLSAAVYAPELDPVEGVWSHLKRSLANLTKHSLDQLTALVKTRLQRMQYRLRLIEGLIAKTGLEFQPPSPQPLKISSNFVTSVWDASSGLCLSGCCADLQGSGSGAVPCPGKCRQPMEGLNVGCCGALQGGSPREDSASRPTSTGGGL